MKIMVTSFKRSHACRAAFSAPNHAAGHCWPTPPSETIGLSWASLGQSLKGSLFLSPGSWFAQVLVCALQESVSQSCVNFIGFMVGLMDTSSKRAYAIPMSTALRAPAPAAVHCWPVPLQETLKQNSGSVSVGSLGPGVHKVCLSTLSVSGRYGVHPKVTKIKCWRECAGKGILLHRCRGCKLVQSLWRTIWRFLKKLKM